MFRGDNVVGYKYFLPSLDRNGMATRELVKYVKLVYDLRKDFQILLHRNVLQSRSF